MTTHMDGNAGFIAELKERAEQAERERDEARADNEAAIQAITEILSADFEEAPLGVWVRRLAAELLTARAELTRLRADLARVGEALEWLYRLEAQAEKVYQLRVHLFFQEDEGQDPLKLHDALLALGRIIKEKFDKPALIDVSAIAEGEGGQ